MEGEQHNTYDIEFYGPNTMMGTLYLGALLAGERMARAMGDEAAAAEYRRVFESGRAKLDSELWGDGFYVQRVPDPAGRQGRRTVGRQEAWHASAVDRGGAEVPVRRGLPVGPAARPVVRRGRRSRPPAAARSRARGAALDLRAQLQAQTSSTHPNTQRIYALNDEKGLVLCSWPHGQRPALPFVYSDEVWTGIEYQVAAHLIYEGLVIEGLAITQARARPVRRRAAQPVERGRVRHRTTRARWPSWSLLTALSGYAWSAPEGRLAFAPKITPEDFRAFFTTGDGWGMFAQRIQPGTAAATIDLLFGTLALNSLAFGPVTLPTPPSVKATVGGAPVTARLADRAGAVTFDNTVRLKKGERLEITLDAARTG